MDNKAKVTITFRHMDHSSALEEHTLNQLAKLDKFIDQERTPIFVECVLEAQRTHHHHRVELRVKTPHYTLNAHKEGPEIYQVVIEATDAMCHELGRAKQEFVEKTKQGRPPRPG